MQLVSDKAPGYGPKPDCYVCQHREVVIPGKTQVRCNNSRDSWRLGIVGCRTGRGEGQFNWPYKFEPVWLVQCLGFKERKREKTKDYCVGDVEQDMFEEFMSSIREGLHDFRGWWGSKEFWSFIKLIAFMVVVAWLWVRVVIFGVVRFLIEWQSDGIIIACTNFVERYAFW